MSIFGKIVERVFHRHASAAPPDTALPDSANVGTATTTRLATPEMGAMQVPTLPIGAAAASVPAAAAPEPPAAGPVDARMLIADLADKTGQRWNWQESIVDLMKLLGLDSSLSARQQLADELGYVGDKHDSAAMNVWLHGQVMQRLSANGGVVPPELRA